MSVPDDYKVLEYNDVPNVKVVNGKKVFNCTLCGECCHIREKDKGISLEDEEKYRQYMYSKFGILYLARLNDITINVWPEEAELLKQDAKEKNIKIKILPKRIIYDKKHHEIIILDYYIDHDVCPFFNAKDKLCGVYEHRPIICRSYPLLTTKNLGKCSYKLNDPLDYDTEMDAAEKLDKMVNLQKNVIKQMIDSGNIEIPESITPVELDSILRSAKFKELRIMDKI
ncbi:MAG TPA: YkgJ family cysteine cluster protein [Alphaproteobacteria bacterium]|nr:YkgJ family cysteine cluster protein [Alphaproteobacteria bacterium]